MGAGIFQHFRAHRLQASVRRINFLVIHFTSEHFAESMRLLATTTERPVSVHYVVPEPVSAMLERSGLPSTTFTRRFKRATGYRPMDYVLTLRVEEAKELLERSELSIDEIGHSVGYEDPASFRRLFKRKAGMAPSVYRRRFGRHRFGRYELTH